MFLIDYILKQFLNYCGNVQQTKYAKSISIYNVQVNTSSVTGVRLFRSEFQFTSIPSPHSPQIFPNRLIRFDRGENKLPGRTVTVQCGVYS